MPFIKTFALILLSFAFIVAGANHFYQPTMYLSIMPPYLPYPEALVFISGLFELLGGLAILFKQLRYAAGIGLMILCIAVFPANIHMALNTHLFAEVADTWIWYLRLPLQLVIMYWIYYSCLLKEALIKDSSSKI